MRVVRVYHAGRDAAHRARERALVAQGVALRLIVPTSWPGPDEVSDEGYDVVQLPVRRPGDVNRHLYSSGEDLRAAIEQWQPDVVDIHEEPFSLVARQVLSVTQRPTVMYSAQNLDKRWPPPFSRILRGSYQRVAGFYPCSRQAAAVLERSGYRGMIKPLPLGIDPSVNFVAGERPDEPFTLGLVGRLVPEKGLLHAIRVTRELAAQRPTRLVVVGSGPEEAAGRAAAAGLDVEWVPWVDAPQLAELYRRMHVVLVPSRATATWVEQFGRVITEGWANGVVPAGYASGSIPEVIGDAGVVVPEGDLVGLAAGVAELAADAERLERLRAAGVTRASSMTWERVAAGMMDLYSQALAQPRPPASAGRRSSSSFGLPARTNVSSRPIALPILRNSAALHALLDRVDR